MIEIGPPALYLGDKVEKTRSYKKIAEAGFTLLHAICADLSNYHTLNLAEPKNPVVSLRQGGPLKLKAGTADNIEYTFYERGIQTIPSLVKRYNNTQYSSNESDKTTSNLSTTNHNDTTFFQDNLQNLVGALGRIVRPGSETGKIAANYDTAYPITDPSLMLVRNENAMVEGVISTYMAAAWLSQQPIAGMEHLDTRSRFLTVLRSNAVSELTKLADMGITVRLPSLDVIPEVLLRLDQETGEIVLHDDAKLTVELLNGLESADVPVDLVCPFAFPLKNGRVRESVNSYAGTLSANVVGLMTAGTNKTGMNIAGNAIADFLTNSVA